MVAPRVGVACLNNEGKPYMADIIDLRPTPQGEPIETDPEKLQETIRQMSAEIVELREQLRQLRLTPDAGAGGANPGNK